MLKHALTAAASVAALTIAAPALAQTTPPAGGVSVAATFPGIMYEVPATNMDDGTGNVCKAPIVPIPMPLHHARPMNTYCGFVSKGVPFMSNDWNPSAGTYLFDPIDRAMDYFKSMGVAVEHTTLKDNGVPFTFDSSVQANIDALDTSTRALSTHEASRGTPFAQWQPANEPTDTTNYWNSTMTDLGVFYCTQAIAVAATSPTTELVDPGWTPTGNGTAGAGLPSSFAYTWDKYIRARQARCPSNKPKWMDVHGYAPASAGPLTTNSTSGSPEQIYGALNTAIALYRSLGESDLKLQVSEGFVRGSRSFNNLTAAGDQAAQVLLLSSYYNKGLQVTWYNFEALSWRQSGNVAQLQNGYTAMAYSPDWLNMTGRIVKFWYGQLAGAKWTTPIARTAGTNLVTARPEDPTKASQFVAGKLSGTGSVPANCPAGVPSGTGSLPASWGIVNNGGSTGVFMYFMGLVTDVEGITSARFMSCGADTTAGSSTRGQLIKIEASHAAVASANYFSGVNLAMSAGDMTNIQNIEFKTFDQASNYATQQTIYPVNRPVSENRQEYRSNTLSSSTSLTMAMQVNYYYNGSSPLPIYWQLDIALPTLEQTTPVYTGILQTADGQTHCVAWVSGSENNGVSWTPPAACSTHTHWTDGISGDHTFSAGGSLTLSNVPIFTSYSAPKMRVGMNDNDPLMQAAFKANG